jgi:hypothetical protein
MINLKVRDLEISEPVIAVRDELNASYQIVTIDFIFSKWGNRFVVQNFLDDTSNPDLVSCCFVGD